MSVFLVYISVKYFYGIAEGEGAINLTAPDFHRL
jgi:hypothetical protein